MASLDDFRRGFTTTSAAETHMLAEQFAGLVPPDTVLALHGDLGVGKTTFVQGLARGFGIQDHVTSPTFNIYTVHAPKPDATHARTLVHVDAYRLEHPHQLEALLIEDFLVSPWCMAVEWPEKVAAWLPPTAWHLELRIVEGERHTLRLC